MPFIELGTTDQLKLKIPTNGSTNWGNVLKTDLFQRLVEHDHSGSGKGARLGAGSILDDAISGSKFRLLNDEYLRARNLANDGDINILKVDINDEVLINASKLLSKESSILNDDTTALTDAEVITLTGTETCTIFAKIERGALVEKTILELTANDDGIVQTVSGDDTGVEFDLVSGQLQYTSTATGDNATISYIIIKE